MSILDNPFRLTMSDEFETNTDVSDEIESLANVRLGLERGDFQGVVLSPSGLNSAVHYAKDRLKQRFVNGMSYKNPVLFNLDVAKTLGVQTSNYETICQLSIKDNTLKVNREKVGFDTKEESLIQKIRDNKDYVCTVPLDKVLKDDMRIDYNFCNAFSAAEDRYIQMNAGRGFIYMPITLSGNPAGGGVTVGFSSYTPNLNDFGYGSYTGNGLTTKECTCIKNTSGESVEITLTSEQGWFTDIRFQGDMTPPTQVMVNVVQRYSENGYNYLTTGITSYRKVALGNNTHRYYFYPTNYVREFPATGAPSDYYFGYRRTDDKPLTMSGAEAVFHSQDDNFNVKFYVALTKVGLYKGQPCVTLFSALNSCLSQIAGASSEIDIILNNLRKDLKFDAVLTNPLNYKPTNIKYYSVKTTIYDVLSAIDAIYCIGIEEVIGNKLRVADRDKIRRRFNPAEVEDYAELQIEHDNEILFKTIKAGCNKGIASDEDGKIEIHGELSYQIPDMSDHGTEYDISLVYYANPSGIEQYLKESQQTENETKNKSNVKDDTIFIYAVTTNNLLPDSNFRLYTLAQDKMSGIPVNTYNLPISPARCMIRHANYLVGTLRAFRDLSKNFTLAKSQNVSVVVGSSILPFEKQWVSENTDTLNLTNAKAFLTTKKVSFKADVYFSDKLKLANRNNPLSVKSSLLPKVVEAGKIYEAPPFSEEEQELVISPMGIDYSFCENESSEITGTLATNETELNGSYYLSNYCQTNIF